MELKTGWSPLVVMKLPCVNCGCFKTHSLCRELGGVIRHYLYTCGTCGYSSEYTAEYLLNTEKDKRAKEIKMESVVIETYSKTKDAVLVDEYLTNHSARSMLIIDFMLEHDSEWVLEKAKAWAAGKGLELDEE